MTIEVPERIRRQLMAAAGAAAPLEACGLLAGKTGRVETFYLMTNADASAEHFSLLPKEQFAAAKDMRVRGWEIMAIWHSHPTTPARMSAEDLRLAYTPGVVYLVTSLAVPPDEALRGYLVEDSRPQPVEVRIVPS